MAARLKTCSGCGRLKRIGQTRSRCRDCRKAGNTGLPCELCGKETSGDDLVLWSNIWFICPECFFAQQKFAALNQQQA